MTSIQDHLYSFELLLLLGFYYGFASLGSYTCFETTIFFRKKLNELCCTKRNKQVSIFEEESTQHSL